MKNLIYAALFLIISAVNAQESISYQKPPKEILELVDVKRAPSVLMDDDNKTMVLLYRDSYKTIEELSQKELRLGGLRIDPVTNIGSRMTYYNDIKIKHLDGEIGKLLSVRGLPEVPRMANFSWSPNEKLIAFTNTTNSGVEIWILNITKLAAHKLTNATVNANLGDVINWFKDSKALLAKMIPENKEPIIETENTIPTGPTVSVNDGKKAQNRTYQDLLKNKNDEHNFEQLAKSKIVKIFLDGKTEVWLGSDMYRNISFSPDGNYVLVTIIETPFSYLVPYYRFPSKTTVYTKKAKLIETIAQVPLIEDMPKGFMATREGRRNINWRSDKASTLVFFEALDGGDPANKVEFRDEVFELSAPFNSNPNSIISTINRCSWIQWGTNNIAIAHDYWWNTRNTKTYVFNPSDSTQKPMVISDRNYQDKYNDPGTFVTKKNHFGNYILDIKDDNAFLIGAGYTDYGQFPFVDEINLISAKKERIYQSTLVDSIENIREYDRKKNQLLVRIESATKYPNYYFRDIKSNKLKQLTFFKNPFESIINIDKEVITYKRDDGLELSGTLYLPSGYDKNSKKKMPMIIWAYPEEFKDKASAGQKTQNPNEFTYPYYGSMIYWVTQGYVILDDASFPIIGEGDTEPNDSFRQQLVSNAKAAIDAVDSLGYIDRNKVAIGGHSYGAFMVANLLSHSDLFAAGIARSGAYNRTLTPFGFQSEERSYWEAPEIYNAMSPFMHADKMKTPLLLIHGEADNNSGTYPLQSERYFNALKGLGATVRLVMLPKESHGYRAKESILHLLWEQDQWLEKYVKNNDTSK